MSRQSQSILLGLLLAFIAGGGWLAARRLGAGLDLTFDLGAGDTALAAESDDARGLVAPSPGGEAEGDREALARPLEFESQGADRPVPPDALWLDGRVVFPPGTPPDEEVRIHARGKAFDGWSGRDTKTYTAEVADDGTFRVAFERRTTKGRITLSGKYLFMRTPMRVDPRSLPEALVLEPELGGRIRATVLPPPGLGLDMEVFSTVQIRARSSVTHGVPQVTTGSVDGVFAVDALPAALDYRVEAAARVYAGDIRRGVEVRPGETTEIELHFELGVEVSGRVIDASGAGVANARLTLLSTAIRQGSRRTKSTRARTDANGGFRVRGVPAGTVELETDHSGFLPAREELGVLENGAVRSGLVFTLDSGRFIAGLVQWPDGRPAERATVRVEQGRDYGGFFANEGQFTARTGADGRFRLSGLGDDVIEVTATARADRDASGTRAKWSVELADVRPDSANLLLVLSAGWELAGRVVDDRGVPVTAFEVVVRPPDEFLQFSSREIERRFESEDGTFTLDGLLEGEWRVAAEALGHGPSEQRTITVPQTGPGPTFVLPRAASVSGIVRDRAGAAVRGAQVTLEPKPTSVRFFELSSSLEEAGDTTNDEGHFAFTSIAPGEVRLRASTPYSGASEWLDLSVGSAEERTGVDLVLRRPARLTGVVSSVVGRVAGRFITVRDSDRNTTKRLESDANGRFAAEGLAPGICRVTLEPEDGVPDSMAYSVLAAMRMTVRVELVEGGAVHVVLGAPPEHAIRVHGRVLAGGAGLADVSIIARLVRGGGDRFHARTGSNGAYEVVVNGPGTYHFSIDAGGGTNVGYGQELPDVLSFALDFELPSARLAGVVRGPGGEPLAGIAVSLECTKPAEPGRGWAPMQRLKSSASGTFAFERLGAGEYLLRAGGVDPWSFDASTAAYGRAALGGITLERGETRSGVDVALQRGGHIEARISGLDGFAAQNARVEILDAAGNKLWPWFPMTTDGSGTIRIRGVGPGRVTLRALAGERASAARAVDVHAGETVEVTLAIE